MDKSGSGEQIKKQKCQITEETVSRSEEARY